MTDPIQILILLSLLQVKHLLADFVWQSDWMVRNKVHYGHAGGIAHAGMHAGLSLLVLLAVDEPFALALTVAALEGVVHYHIDYARCKAAGRWVPAPSSQGFWVLMGADQLLHQLTYLVLAALVLGNS
ncbi:DUF3307 domain-containing protein [Phaeovulum sp. NW3]|uniref:DUF3307 domain-containing protein n=1 Tax=Phaeovulum sp. NW3 TaxID=2934933 RepID=UPI00201FF292|nr:DUF3307 domain-containing protein [Phaeovulum sp. NW3]MCL7466793.1 DUF3307 domain-containing protein [Phaeovulum sp. NW3]